MEEMKEEIALMLSYALIKILTFFEFIIINSKIFIVGVFSALLSDSRNKELTWKERGISAIIAGCMGSLIVVILQYAASKNFPWVKEVIEKPMITVWIGILIGFFWREIFDILRTITISLLNTNFKIKLKK